MHEREPEQQLPLSFEINSNVPSLLRLFRRNSRIFYHRGKSGNTHCPGNDNSHLRHN
jgi:hypothetical protein